jgi:cytochrome c oxidase assembly protein subunit 15
MNDSSQALTPRWLHFWSMLTVCAALPLLLLGAEVTTKGVGMVDARGLRPPWHFFTSFMEDRGLGWMIEHGHRQAGFLVGICVIVLAAGLWRRESRRGLRWLGVLALAAICLQGTLGIFRIELNALMGRGLALVHGSFAPIVFALFVSLALLTSRSWITFGNTAFQSAAIRHWSLVTLGLVFAQIVLGSAVRHQDWPLAARGHLLLAFGVVAAVLWLAKLTLEAPGPKPALPVIMLLSLIVVQLFLGVESWLAKFFTPASPWRQLEPLPLHPDFLRSLHYLGGTLIFATTVVVTLYAHRNWSPALAQADVPAGHLEGVA